MSRHCEPVSCRSTAGPLGGIAAEDFSVLDKLAVKLICLDSGFSAPLRQVGERIGGRIAVEHREKPLSLDAGLAALLPACGLQGVLDSHYERQDSDSALLQISGCAAVLGWKIPNLSRAVCSFDTGLFEGFLRGVTTEEALTVEEISCLGRGDSCCEFAIRRRPDFAGGREEGAHGDR